MDSISQDSSYQKIKELLYDDEEIVTNISLAAALKISLNNAKTLLTTFTEDIHRLKLRNLHVTYIIAGGLKNGKGLTVSFVEEENLNEKKALFENIFEISIYGIHKNKDINLSNIIEVNKNSMESFQFYGPVIGKNCITRNIKKKDMFHQSKSDGESAFKKKPLVSTTCSTQMNANSQDNNVFSQNKQSKERQSSNISNYFAKAVTTANKTVQENNKNSKVNGNSSLKSGNVCVISSQNKLVNLKCDNGNIEDNLHNREQKKENVNSVLESPITSNLCKKRKKKDEVSNTNKKRKRIQEICDSDSSDMFEDEKDEDIIEKSDDEKPEPIVKLVLLPKNKNRKTVDETYIDEEGFMVTTTKYIYESASEDEGKQKQTTENKVPIVLKKSSSSDLENDNKKIHNKTNKSKKTVNGKQTTLMNFFNKK